MPGPRTLSVAPSTQRCSTDGLLEGSTVEVSANIKEAAHTPGSGGLTAPPRDVDRMLQRYGASLPQYLDVQQQRVVASSMQRWPLLQSSRAQGKRP